MCIYNNFDIHKYMTIRLKSTEKFKMQPLLLIETVTTILQQFFFNCFHFFFFLGNRSIKI